MTRLTLRTRLAIWFAASILIILAPILTALVVVQWRSMRAALDHHLEEDLAVAVTMLVELDGRLEWRAAAERDPGYDAGPQRWVEVHSARGEPLLLRGAARRPGVRGALPNPAAVPDGYSTVRTPAGAYVRTLVERHAVGSKEAIVRVARTEDALRADLAQMSGAFAIGAPLAVLVAALAGYWISGRALLPLAHMAERARSISADHLSQRLPIDNPSDEMGQLAIVFNDTFARLEQSFERLKRFTADASHELRTPLTAIRSVGEVGLREARDARAYQEIIGSMLEEADRLASVVDTLLTLSRWESGRSPARVEAVDLAALAHDVATQLAAVAEDRDIAIDVDLTRAALAMADPVMTRQAVTNVLDNAIKFTREGGRIAVWSRRVGTHEELVVDDEGPGIPEGQRARVLERFYRIDGARGGTGGAGLGLAIVLQAMAVNRGRVTIEDNAARGARVILALPRADVPAPA